MANNFLSLIFIWLLPLTASSTSGQNHNFTDVMTGEVGNNLTLDELTTQEASILNPISEVSSNITASIIVEVNATEEKTTKPSTEPSLQTTPATPYKTFSSNIQRAATPTNFISNQLNSSTEGMKSMTEVQFKVTTSVPMEVTTQASNPTTTTRAPSMPRSSTQSRDTGETMTSPFNRDKMTQLSTRPTQSESLISTITTSTKPVTGGVTMQSTGLSKTSLSTTKTPFIHITEAKKGEGLQEKKKNAKSKKGTNHSKAVAGIIGGALALMMIGFLVIYIKKHKLQRRQMTTRDWAGPSPFLDGGADNGEVTLRSSNRISLLSFLPQRLSKRLSLLPETDEELEDMTPGTTFGGKHQESISGQEVDGNDVQESNGTAVVEMKSTGEALETVENSVSMPSSQNNNPLSTNNNSEDTNLSEDLPANSPTQSGAMENALAQLNEGLEQP